jgi:hypothetical protein
MLAGSGLLSYRIIGFAEGAPTCIQCRLRLGPTMPQGALDYILTHQR